MAEEVFPSKGYFNSTRFKATKTPFLDGSNGLAGKAAQVISFRHEASGNSVYFKAFIIAFNESYSSDWVPETVFGRADPIQHFKQTSRRMSIGFKIPAATESEAYDNLSRVQQLIQYLYPNYATTDNTQTLSQNPFVRLKVMNLAQKNEPPPDDAKGKSDGMYFKEYKSTADPAKGVLGTITSLNVAHNLEAAEIGVLEIGANTILSKMIEVNLDFTVIHESHLGWNESNEFATPSFPYGAITSETPGGPGTGPPDDARDANETPEERDKRMQDEERARQRYGTMFGKARMKKDLKYLAKMADKDPNSLTKGQLANVNYLLSTTKGAGLEGFDSLEDYEGLHDLRTRKDIKDTADDLHGEFIK